MTTATENRKQPNGESGMTLLAIMAVMAIFAIGLLAVAPSVQLGVQREKELESIRRGEEIAEAIRQYIQFHNGAKLPESIDDLLEGLPRDPAAEPQHELGAESCRRVESRKEDFAKERNLLPRINECDAPRHRALRAANDQQLLATVMRTSAP